MNILTVDVEDWFHILEVEGTPDLERWRGLESRVARGFHTLLDLCDEAGARATCFFLGWVAERFPELVRAAHARGHEVASHGYAHRLVYDQRPAEFGADIRRAKDVLEQACGAAVDGYRAPGFSIRADTPWAFDEIAAAGYRYDASVFPGPRGHGGLPGAPLGPHLLETRAGRLVEFPATVVDLGLARVCFFGGGYLRLSPYRVMAGMTRLVNLRRRPVIYYVHPREVDPDHPRLAMSRLRRFKSYVNLRSTAPKLRRLLRAQRLGTFREWLAAEGARLASC